MYFFLFFVIIFIMKNKYKIILFDDFVNIYSYFEIINISCDQIFIDMKLFKLKVIGESLIVVQMDENDLSIKGEIKEIKYLYE